MEALKETVLFSIAVGIFLFAPGWVILSLFFNKRNQLLPFETLIFSFGISVGLIDFLMILLGKMHILLSPTALITSIIATLILFLFVSKIPVLLGGDTAFKYENIQKYVFSHKQKMLFIVLVALTICIKSIFLAYAVLPTATDLGHHMYWSKFIAVTGTLPLYGKQEIITGSNGAYTLSTPEPIADFIIGEHLPFAALSIVTKLDFFSAFPVNLLLLVNLLSLLALAALALRLTADIYHPLFSKKIFTPQNVGLAALFFFGPLYSLASPQAKFISGGVVGNTFGNFFIPLIILAYYRAFKEKGSGFLALGFFLTFTLAYTHHLSTLVLLFILITSAGIALLFHCETLGTTLRGWLKLMLTPAPIIVLFFACTFFFLIAMPTYIETNAVGTALGTPTKTTRTGLSFLQVTFSSGEARVALGLAGIALLLAFATRTRYGGAFLLGWSIILLLMTLEPQWLLIDIPSNRIGSYLSFPLGMLSAIAAVAFFATFRSGIATFRIPYFLFLIASSSLFVFSAGSGSFDNSQALLPKSKAFDTVQTFAASQYLAEKTTSGDIILKDHNYIVADSWMKLFFLRDYTYPLSRGFFKRYEDNPSREQCTLLSISVPNTPSGEKCYTDLGIDYVAVNPHFDAVQFEKSGKFSRVYTSDSIHIYKRKQ